MERGFLSKLKKHQGIIFFFFSLLIALFILFLRQPSALLQPQFWAEDGRVWYSDAYNIGWKSLFIPQDGYFQTISRLVALLTQIFPFRLGPLVFNSAALFIQALPAVFILSKRFNKLAPKFWVRTLFAIYYLLLPNTGEIHGNLTNSQWFLSLLACLVLIAEAPGSLFQKIFDTIVLLLSGLSGPFVIFLFPVAFLMYWKNQTGWKPKLFLIVLSCAAIQFISLIFLSLGSRLYLSPKIIWGLLPDILVHQVFLGSILGQNGYLWVLKQSWSEALFVLVNLSALGLIVRCAFKATFEQKLFLFFAMLILISSLLNPTTVVSPEEAWKVLSINLAGIRYWLIPMLAFISVLFFNAGKSSPIIIRSMALLFLSLGIVGIIADFQHHRLPDKAFAKYVEVFNSAPNGKKVIIPINPQAFYLRLIKH